MSETGKPEVGTIAWQDLTVENATEIGQFYAEVVGWKAEPVDMGGYSDLNMSGPDSGNPLVIRDPAGAVSALFEPAT